MNYEHTSPKSTPVDDHEQIRNQPEVVDNEPEPMGVGYTDLPMCLSKGGPSFLGEEKLEARREAGQNLGEEPDAHLRREEETIDVIGMDGEKPFINLTPYEEHGCYLPLAYFEEFLRLKNGQSILKHGSAWFYTSPHDAEECIYRASVDGNLLSVEVEVGTEARVRRASLGLYAGVAEQ